MDKLSIEAVASRILVIRGKKVMLDRDLAELYGVATKNLNKAVKRNGSRFPEDFMFQLSASELESLRFQNGTSKRGGRRYLPYVFTQEGVAMLSSVLNSERDRSEYCHNEGVCIASFEAIRQLLKAPEPPPPPQAPEKPKIGFGK